MPKKKPSIHQLKQVPGYETASFKPALVPPNGVNGLENPPEEEPTCAVDGQLKPRRQPITRDNVSDALARFLSKKRFLAWRSLKDASILDVVTQHVLHYSLETYTEKRFINWAFKPAATSSTDESVPEILAPSPWDVDGEHTLCAIFKEEKFSVEVPHSAQLGVCHNCVGIGRMRCDECKGEGGDKCLTCHGSGTCRSGWGQIKCKGCNGSGRNRCKDCKGHGQVECEECNKKCRLKYYMNLTVQRSTTTSHEFGHQMELPEDLLVAAKADVLWEATGKRVLPIRFHPEEFVMLASERIFKEHDNNTLNEKILHQRQRLRSIPVATVHYSRGAKKGQFIVYGLDNKIYIPRAKTQPHVSCNVM